MGTRLASALMAFLILGATATPLRANAREITPKNESAKVIPLTTLEAMIGPKAIFKATLIAIVTKDGSLHSLKVVGTYNDPKLFNWLHKSKIDETLAASELKAGKFLTFTPYLNLCGRAIDPKKGGGISIGFYPSDKALQHRLSEFIDLKLVKTGNTWELRRFNGSRQTRFDRVTFSSSPTALDRIEFYDGSSKVGDLNIAFSQKQREAVYQRHKKTQEDYYRTHSPSGNGSRVHLGQSVRVE